MGRSPCCDKSKVKRGPWSAEEDAILKNYLHENGTTGNNWITLPNKAGLNRCGKSCRLRWLNYLKPDINRRSFTEEEGNIICTLYRSIGSRWSVIASHLPGRTDNDVKNYWNTKLKKKLPLEAAAARNDYNVATRNKTSDDHSSINVQFSSPETETLDAEDISVMHGFNQPKQTYEPWWHNFSDLKPTEVSGFGSSTSSENNSFGVVPLSHNQVSSLPCSSNLAQLDHDQYHYPLWSGYEGNSEFLMDLGFESTLEDLFLLGGFGFY